MATCISETIRRGIGQAKSKQLINVIGLLQSPATNTFCVTKWWKQPFRFVESISRKKDNLIE